MVAALVTCGTELAAGHPMACYRSLRRARMLGAYLGFTTLHDTLVALNGWVATASKDLPQ